MICDFLFGQGQKRDKHTETGGQWPAAQFPDDLSRQREGCTPASPVIRFPPPPAGWTPEKPPDLRPEAKRQ
jgi:hypothetical protein